MGDSATFGLIELALLSALITVLVSAFLIGRLDNWRRGVMLERSIAALRQIKEEEQDRVEGKRKEMEHLLGQEIRAREALERWETLRQDHRNLDAMKVELEQFEREESTRIDELERRRAEAARRLADIQSSLDSYPPEITDSEANWTEYLEKRKRDYDELRAEVARLESQKEQFHHQVQEMEKQQAQLQRSLSESQQKLADAEQKREAVAAATQTINAAAIKFPDDSLNVVVKEIPGNADSGDKFAMFKFMPGCLKPFDQPSTEELENKMLLDFESDLDKQGLNYPKQIIFAFHTALKVSDLSPLTVLSGLSGTGKSQLPRAYARFFGIHFLHVPVEPGWDSPQDLLGFYDFVAGRYRPTDRARALGHFDRDFAEEIGIESEKDWSQRMLIILLDEMNLARTEYYFSEFLSRLEMRGSRTLSGHNSQDDDSRRDSQIAIDMPYAENEPPKHLHVPHNVLWVGTLNEDETTQALSDKVLDRANSIRFAPPDPSTLRRHSTSPERDFHQSEGYLPYERWLKWSEDGSTVEKLEEEKEVDSTLETLAGLMQNAGRGFGYRITQSIKTYIRRYPGPDWRQPMLDQINMRLLPKLAGAEMSDCSDAIGNLQELTEDKLGNPHFAKALAKAAKHSEASQIFNWPGYTYEEESS